VAQRAEEIRIARAAPVWEDPYSGLIWATHTNGRTLKWSGAKSYCQNLTPGGQKGWRLPTKDELRGIYDPSNGPDHAAGGIQLNGHFLILTAQAPYRGPGLFDKVMGGVVSVEAAAAGTPDPGSSSSSSSSYYYFDFASGRDSVLRSPPPDGQALCVRGSGQ
jgi:hypothetical protein